MSLRGWTGCLIAAALTTACPMLGGGNDGDHAAPDEGQRTWGRRVVVREDTPELSGPPEDERGTRFESPIGSPGPNIGQPPTPEEPMEMAVGWVSVSSSDGEAYEVWQQGARRGYTALRLTQRPGSGVYETRDPSGRRLCRGQVEVRRYEEVCMVCDVRTGRFRRERC